MTMLRAAIFQTSMISAFSEQVRIALRNCGRMITRICPHISLGAVILPLQERCEESEKVVNTIEKSGLRGRGGAGFPRGIKLRSGKMLKVPSNISYAMQMKETQAPLWIEAL